ncbi:MAG: DUF4398 domain-containing protein [Proteobacteria bacterium]|nr:DUF4398 domain-containing protein [Pseudomonadota bacterium]
MNGRLSVPVVSFVVLLLAGCAPIEYTVVIVEASQAVAAAEVAGAHCTDAQLEARSPVAAASAPDPGTAIATTDTAKPSASSLEGKPQCAAPYEYYSAVEFLHKAREEVGYSDYEAAIEYAREARSFARSAREIALRYSRERGR